MRVKTTVINVSTSVDITRIIPFQRWEIEALHSLMSGMAFPMDVAMSNGILGKLNAILEETK